MNRCIAFPIVCAAATVLALLDRGAFADASSDLQGRWQVVSYASVTRSLDGVEVVKGPFTTKPAEMTLLVTANRYVSNDGRRQISYTLRRNGKTAVLTRKAEGSDVSVTVSEVLRTGSELRFTSTRVNKGRKEQYVVTWVCRPLPRR